MARKKFTKEIKGRGIDALFSEGVSDQEDYDSVEIKGGLKDNTNAKTKRSSSKKSLEKISFNLDFEASEKLKAFAFNKRISTTEILKKCVDEYFSNVPEEEIAQSLQVYRNAN